MRREDLPEQRRRLLSVFTADEMRAIFVARTDDEMFFEIGAADLGPIATAGLQSDGKAYIITWHGFEFLCGRRS